MKFFIFVLFSVTGVLAWAPVARIHFSAIAKEATPVLPIVSAAPVPLYPPLARVANAQGVIHVKVETDGHKVVQAHAEEQHKLLSMAAEENAKNWAFTQHAPVTFTITYRYRLADECGPNNPTVTLHLPTEVEVCQHTFRFD